MYSLVLLRFFFRVVVSAVFREVWMATIAVNAMLHDRFKVRCIRGLLPFALEHLPQL